MREFYHAWEALARLATDWMVVYILWRHAFPKKPRPRNYGMSEAHYQARRFPAQTED